MHRLLKLAVPAGLTFALAACAGQTNTSVPSLTGQGAASSSHQAQSSQKLPDGIQLGRHFMGVRGGTHDIHKESGLLNYSGGHVQNTPKIYVIYWKFNKKGDPGKAEQTIINSFLSNVGGSNWLNTVTQYYDQPGGYIANLTPEYVSGKTTGYILDNKTAVPSVPTDAELQTEAKKLVDQFGADPDASYVVATPHGHNTSGFGTQYCAYHGAFTYDNVVIGYTDMPYMSDAGPSCGSGFVNNPGIYDGVTIVEGHELAETQTDPGADYSGWGGNEGEIGDICAWDSTTSNQPFGSTTYPVQPLYSDKSKACVLSGP